MARSDAGFHKSNIQSEHQILQRYYLRNLDSISVIDKEQVKFKLIKQLKSGVRVGEISTAHGKIGTPFFMPVGTVGSVRGVSPAELKALGAEIVLSNTYHLFLRPGEQNIKKLGGLHKFMNWNKPILTDSGGYQVFSLKSLAKITDNGVEFTSHIDGSKHLFTPERVIQIQLDLGVDILMPLDYCPSGKANKKEIERAVEITINWAKRSKKYFDDKSQITNHKSQTNSKLQIQISKNSEAIEQSSKKNSFALFGIVQGGLDIKLRKYCAEELIKLGFDGYAVGGLAVDHETRDMWETVKQMGDILPIDKPRYLMGVGTLDDIVKATRLGMDMFDCVLPTRLARHGSVYVKTNNEKLKTLDKYILLNLLNSKYRTDPEVIDKDCACPACERGAGFSRAYISHLIRENEILGIRLTTLHNLHQYLELMRELKHQQKQDTLNK